MRASRALLGIGILVFFMLAGIAFFLMPASVSQGPAVEVVVPPEGIVPAATGAPLLMIAMAAIVVVLALVGAVTILRTAVTVSKRKHEDMLPPDPYLEDMAERGTFLLEDDGELPDWLDSSLPQEKNKRS